MLAIIVFVLFLTVRFKTHDCSSIPFLFKLFCVFLLTLAMLLRRPGLLARYFEHALFFAILLYSVVHEHRFRILSAGFFEFSCTETAMSPQSKLLSVGVRFACDHPRCRMTFATRSGMNMHKRIHDESALRMKFWEFYCFETRGDPWSPCQLCDCFESCL